MMRFASDIIVVSKDLEPYFAKRGRPASVVVSGVPPAVVKRSVAPRRDRTRPYVIVFSRLVAEKRIGDAISAIQSLGSKCDLLIAGAGPDLPRLRSCARGNPHVYFLGHVKPPELWSFVAGAAVSVTTSELEGMPLAVLEALALAVPVIASDIPPASRDSRIPVFPGSSFSGRKRGPAAGAVVHSLGSVGIFCPDRRAPERKTAREI
jgi:glycosyltransferase involved in cell wall biosynthesis